MIDRSMVDLRYRRRAAMAWMQDIVKIVESVPAHDELAGPCSVAGRIAQ